MEWISLLLDATRLLIAQQIEDSRSPNWLRGIAPLLVSPVGLIVLAIFVLVIVAWLAADARRRQQADESDRED